MQSWGYPLCVLTGEPFRCCAVLQANWLGDSREAWQKRLEAGLGASSVSSMLRKHGLPQRLSEALCTELGLQDRRYYHHPLPSEVPFWAAYTELQCSVSFLTL